MSDLSARRLSNLLVATSASAMTLATSALYLADPSSPPYPSLLAEFISEMRKELDALEDCECALMHCSGVSWGVLAEYYGVTRQSLHMRMSWRADQGMEEAQTNSGSNRDRVNDELETARRLIRGLKASSFDDDLSSAVKIWQARKEKTRWWWEDTPLFAKCISSGAVEVRGAPNLSGLALAANVRPAGSVPGPTARRKLA